MSAQPYVSLVDRIPPSNLEAEVALLGAALSEPSLLPRIMTIVKPRDFYATTHESVFLAIGSLYQNGDPIDKITVAEELMRRGMLDKVGGMSFLSELMLTIATADAAEYYAKIVAEKSRLRELIHIGSEITANGYEGEDDAERAIVESFGLIQSFVDSTRPMAHRPMDLIEAGLLLDSAFEDGTAVFYPTPFPVLTKHIGGWKRGGLYPLAGSPKMGKSFFANTCALHLSQLGVGDVLVFALEIGRDETQLRLEQLFSRVNALKRVRRLPLTDAERERIFNAKVELGNYPVVLYDNYPKFSTDEVILAVRRAASERAIAGVFIDHVGYMSDVMSPSPGTIKHNRLEEAIDKLRDAAIRLKIPIFPVWHVNRSAKDGPPTIFDLRDGGNIEGAAQTILFLHRKHWDQSDGTQREASIIIGATRMGHAGTLDAYFDDERGVWCDPDRYAFFDSRPTQAELDMANRNLDAELAEPPY